MATIKTDMPLFKGTPPPPAHIPSPLIQCPLCRHSSSVLKWERLGHCPNCGRPRTAPSR